MQTKEFKNGIINAIRCIISEISPLLLYEIKGIARDHLQPKRRETHATAAKLFVTETFKI